MLNKLEDEEVFINIFYINKDGSFALDEDEDTTRMVTNGFISTLNSNFISAHHNLMFDFPTLKSKVYTTRISINLELKNE
jgi:hypothetical protein